MPSSVTVARKLVELAAARNQSLSPLQVMSLAYICQGWMLALYDRPLFTDPISIEKFGPSIPKLLEAFQFGKDGRILFVPIGTHGVTLEALEEDLVAQVFENYGKFDEAELCALTARSGTPWHHAMRQQARVSEMPLEWIRSYYVTVARQTFAAA